MSAEFQPWWQNANLPGDPYEQQQWRRTVEAAFELGRSCATPAPGAPAGFKLVPIEATPEMVEAICEMHTSGKWPEDFGTYAIAIRRRQAAAGYSAAVEAAPGAPGQEAAAVQAVGAEPVAYSLRWPSDSRLNVGTVFDTQLEAQDHVDRCGEGIEIVPLYAALPPSGAGEKPS